MPPNPLPTIGLGTTTLVSFIILFIVYLLIMGFILWLAGEIVVGRKVTFGEAIAVAGTGTFLVGAVVAFLGLIGLLLGVLIFLLLVKHYFKTGWLGAIGVGITAIVVVVVITFILGAVLVGALFGFPKIF